MKNHYIFIVIRTIISELLYFVQVITFVKHVA